MRLTISVGLLKIRSHPVLKLFLRLFVGIQFCHMIRIRSEMRRILIVNRGESCAHEQTTNVHCHPVMAHE